MKLFNELFLLNKIPDFFFFQSHIVTLLIIFLFWWLKIRYILHKWWKKWLKNLLINIHLRYKSFRKCASHSGCFPSKTGRVFLIWITHTDYISKGQIHSNSLTLTIYYAVVPKKSYRPKGKVFFPHIWCIASVNLGPFVYLTMKIV